MTYANVVFTYGAEAFFARANRWGWMGSSSPTCPMRRRGVPGRLPEARGGPDLHDRPHLRRPHCQDCPGGGGVPLPGLQPGVTGVRQAITTDLAAILQVIRENTDLPCAIGFGIATPDQARQMAALADRGHCGLGH